MLLYSCLGHFNLNWGSEVVELSDENPGRCYFIPHESGQAETDAG